MIRIHPGSRLGRYLIEAEIARGGHSTVYRALRQGPGGFEKQVAIKVLRFTVKPEGAASLFREARNTALLNHRNIVQIHEVSEEEGVRFLVMELVDGLPLSALINEPSAMPLWLAVGVMVEVGRALNYAHSFRDQRCPKGIIHRDVKPSNILISRQGEVKLADFGLAKMVAVARDEITNIGVVKGTPHYMSPEQRDGAIATQSTDIYALGVTLYCALAGTAASPYLRRSSPLPPLSDICSTVPVSLRDVIRRAMQTDPQSRPDTMALIRSLSEEMAKVATPAEISGFCEELGRWVDRAQGRKEEIATAPRSTAEASGPDIFALQVAPASIVTEGVSTSSGSLKTFERPTLKPMQSKELRPVVGSSRRARAAALSLGSAALLVGLWVAWPSGSDPQSRASTPVDSSKKHVAATDRQLPMDAGAPSDKPNAVAALHRSFYRSNAKPEDAGSPRAKTPHKKAYRPRRRPGRASQPQGQGVLSVNAEPWAWVYVDDKRVGMTPLYRVALSVGRHRIKLVDDSGAKKLRRVLIKRQAHTNLGLISMSE